MRARPCYQSSAVLPRGWCVYGWALLWTGTLVASAAVVRTPAGTNAPVPHAACTTNVAPCGDYIIAIGGIAVTNKNDFVRVLIQAYAQDRTNVPVLVQRDGGQEHLTLSYDP